MYFLSRPLPSFTSFVPSFIFLPYGYPNGRDFTIYKDITSNKLPSLPILIEDPLVNDVTNSLNDSMVNHEDNSQQDNSQLYTSWRHSIIIKAFGGKFTHQYVKTKLEAVWHLSEPLCLIDLSLDFYTIKFKNPESQSKVLEGGP